MPIRIDGVQHHTATELADQLGVTRQTLWRWRRDGKVPKGRRYRDGNVVFTSAETDAIREYANHVEPLEESSPAQLKLFNGAI